MIFVYKIIHISFCGVLIDLVLLAREASTELLIILDSII